MIRYHCGRNAAPPSSEPTPSVRGKFSGLRITIRGQRRSFQASSEKWMANVANAGLTRGTMTRENTQYSEQPSTRAASSTGSLSLLLRNLRGEINQPIKQVVEPDLVVRASTAPPRR